MPFERILVTVKTYPTLSKKYGETVCTAGIREDGSWVRLYPVPFRRWNEEQQYKKFDWIECLIDRNTSDHRPETYRPAAFEGIKRVGHVETHDNWRERRREILGKVKVYTNLQELIEGAHANRLSLALFKPTQLLKWVTQSEDRAWDSEKLRQIREISKQPDLFSDESWRETFKVMPKLPYSFSYCFEDDARQRSTLQILDWEIGQLYWNCISSCGGDENAALSKVRKKYWGEFLETDLHFFLGTTHQFHSFAPNPWVIIGVFQIPHDPRLELPLGV